MKNFLRQLPLPAKLILIGSIPLLFVVYLAIRLYNEKAQKVSLLDSYIERIHQSADVTRLIDQLQAERDYSFEHVLQKEKPRGMGAIRAASDSLVKLLSGKSTLTGFTGYTFLDELQEVRLKIDSGRYAANQVIHFYTTAIFRLNTLNPVPLGARIYLPEVNDEIVSQKLLSEIATYLGITSNNVYNVLYTKAYVAETLLGTLGVYQIFQSYEKELMLRGSPATIDNYKAIRSTKPTKDVIDFLDNAFKTFTLGQQYSHREWQELSDRSLAQLRQLQQDLLSGVEMEIGRINNQEKQARNQTLIFLVAAIVVVIALVAFIIQSINETLNKLREGAEKISVGQPGIELPFRSNDAIGSLAESIGKIDRNNQELSKTAQAIGKGDFSASVTPRSEEDVLSNAIEEMKVNFQRYAKRIDDSGRQIRSMMQALPVAVYTCDAEGYIQLYNRAAADLWGREPVPGKDKWCASWKIFRPDGSQMPLDECPMAVTIKEKRKVDAGELILEKPNGERRVIRPNPEPVFDNTGKMTGAVNMLLDITEQKQSEKDTAWLAALVQSSQDAIISKTLDGIITSWNPAAEKLFGYTKEEMIGQSITRLIPADRLGEEVEIIRTISAGKRLQHFDTLRLTKDNRLIDISLSISPILNSRGEVIGASKIARDITKAKLAEEQLRQNEKKFSELANAMSQLVWIAEPDGRVIYFNDRIAEFSGMERMDDGSWTWHGLIHPDDLPATNEAWQKAVHNEAVFVKEHRLQLASGIFRWHLTRVIPYKDDKGKISKWIGTATDIDDMKTMVIQKEDFLSVASHELRTPITSIKAYSQLLGQTYKQSNDAFLKNALAKLEGQANRMTKLVTDFLKLSKIESGKLQLNKERFLINELVNEIATDIQFVAINHKIIVEENATAPVHADRERIAQVIANLLNNAVKYSPGADQVNISISTSNTHVHVAVKDRGIGINPDDQQKIFERFYRAQSNGSIPFSGFGIGLYISAEIIKRHEGEIGVSSELGKGSTFYFTLPHAE